AYTLDFQPQAQGRVFFELTAYQPGSTATSRRGIFSWKLTAMGTQNGGFPFCFSNQIATFDYAAPNGLVNRLFNPVRSHIGPTFFTYRLYSLGSMDTPGCHDSHFEPSEDSTTFHLELLSESGLKSEGSFSILGSSHSAGSSETARPANGSNQGPPRSLNFGWISDPSNTLQVSLTPSVMLVRAPASEIPQSLQIHSNQSTLLSTPPSPSAVDSPFPVPPAGALNLSLADSNGAAISRITTHLLHVSPDDPLEAVWGAISLRAQAGAFFRESPVVWLPNNLPADERLPFVTSPFQVEPLGEPLRKPAVLQLTGDYARNTGLYRWDPFIQRWRYLGSTFSAGGPIPAAASSTAVAGDPPDTGSVTAFISYFDAYAVLLDVVAPVISPPLFVKGRVAIPVTDIGMGIDADRISVTFDNKPIAGEYDEDRRWFLADRPSSKELPPGKLKVIAFDHGGNESKREFNFKNLAP
ncbi:MAG: hypothetical protein ACREJQ_06100, partial [bacterium]